MDEQKISVNLRNEELNEEIKTLISSLPSDKDSSGKDVSKYQGCWYTHHALQAVLSFQKNFKPQDTDVIVASFPKCGTTWLKALTFALLHRSKYSSLHDHHHHPLLSDNPHVLVPYLEMNLYYYSEKPDLTKYSSSPRLFSTHMPLHALQEGLKDSTCKIVYMCRNVKDTLVSYWHFFCKKQINDEVISSFEDTFESFCRGVSLFGPFWDQVLSYWRGSLEDPNHVLFMKYEEMKAEPREQIKRLADFLGCPFTKEEEESGSMDEIIDLCSLRNLSSLEINKTGKLYNGRDNKTFFRKGEVGDWKNYLTPGMENKIDMIIQEKLQNSGLIL
ncbi:PREDICTED: cytosolic sulfotransferase 5-like [Camelina sativa]|uniref:Sulfotransferase n=1 Tax=Camelina sativa TaxID=90675 RepID=A0ABM0Y7G9_CAMSA|nr:PREDICTED: cytosolic sulfotransferase 5-like [Camelina sativa]